MQTETLKMIYFAYFHSVINYGNIAWGKAYSNYLSLLQNLQTRLLECLTAYLMSSKYLLKIAERKN